MDTLQDRQFYFDSSIWVDIHEGENTKKSKTLFQKVIIDDAMLLYSDLSVSELKHLGYTQAQINMLLAIAKPDHLRRVHIYKEQTEESRSIARQRKVPRADVLHAILARDNNAILIATDKDFTKLRDITKAYLPSEFI